MIGPEEEDYKILTNLAGTLLKLKLVSWTPVTTPNSPMSSYIAICDLGQIYWSEHREKHSV